MTGRRYEFAIKFVVLTGNVLPIITFLNFVVGIGGKGGSKRSVAHQLLNRRGDLLRLVWPHEDAAVPVAHDRVDAAGSGRQDA